MTLARTVFYIERREQWRKQYEDGWPMAAIARSSGVTRERVRQVLLTIGYTGARDSQYRCVGFEHPPRYDGHGSWYEAGCRCDECRLGLADRMRAFYHRRRRTYTRKSVQCVTQGCDGRVERSWRIRNRRYCARCVRMLSSAPRWASAGRRATDRLVKGMAKPFPGRPRRRCHVCRTDITDRHLNARYCRKHAADRMQRRHEEARRILLGKR